ncbi:MAG: cheB5 [Bacillales bacterium]|jgi:two-component system chemotaxis response regulator CheB|nr:cheB5 [Bacillales bacterium]
MITRKIRVLVVDDSHVYREVISKGISTNPYIEVVATAIDPFDARDKILKYNPDVMTCDIEMPKMNGIEFIKRLLPQYPLPVIIVSSVSEAVLDAINAGAVEFVSKPNMRVTKSVEEFLLELISKIKIASEARIIKGNNEQRAVNQKETFVKSSERIIAIGSSTGGTEALSSLLKNLPQNVPGIVIVQHIPPEFSKMLANRFDQQTHFQVKEAVTGDIVEPGKVFIAPGDQHIKIFKDGDVYKIKCFYGEKVNGHCPSVDVLFESVAKEAGNKAIGVILTGMGYDGAKGLLQMKRKGARTIGQNEASSVVYGMPKAAFNIGAVEKQGALENIPGLIIQSLKQLG